MRVGSLDEVDCACDQSDTERRSCAAASTERSRDWKSASADCLAVTSEACVSSFVRG